MIWMRSHVMLVIGLSLAPVATAAAQWRQDLAACKSPPVAKHQPGPLQSVLIPMRDGVRIALDIVLPDPLPPGGKVPTVLTMTRYWRSREGMGPSSFELLFPKYGYAMVSGDSRGTGASFGTWVHPRQPDERLDFGEVVDWIAKQPWSDGNVGATGTSYGANTADWTAQNARPALKAIIPRHPDFDPYMDLYFPGGIFHTAFGKGWSDGVRSQDLNEKRAGPDGVARGVRPVGADGEQLLAEAIQQRVKLPGYYDGLVKVTYRDDRPDIWGDSFQDWSIQEQRAVFERTRTPEYVWAGWMDAGTPAGALRRFMSWNVPQRVIVGPWNHGGRLHTSPYLAADAPTTPDTATQTSETVCYFDEFLKGQDQGIKSRQLIYYTMGEEQWKTTDTWPPSNAKPQRWYLSAGGRLARSAPAQRSGEDRYPVDFTTTTGKRTNRWQTQNGGGDVVYPDRAEEDKKLLTYTSPPLEQDVEITGHPVVSLNVASTATDGAFFAYLEDVDASGRVYYLTEGQLRALHRKVSSEAKSYTEPIPYHTYRKADGAPMVPGQVAEVTFGLLPTSVVIRRGHRLRIAVAGADSGTFVRIPAEGPAPVWSVQRNAAQASWVEVPVVPR